MREVDRKAQEVYGIPELVLMENAGHATAETAEKLLGGKDADEGNVFAFERGNNGGDAFSAARYFLNAGANVKVFFAGNRDHIKASPKIMLGILQKMDALIYPLDDDHDFDRFRVALRFADLVIDGVLGTPRGDRSGRHSLANSSEARGDLGHIRAEHAVEAGFLPRPVDAVRLDSSALCHSLWVVWFVAHLDLVCRQ